MDTSRAECWAGETETALSWGVVPGGDQEARQQPIRSDGRTGMNEKGSEPRDPLPSGVYVLWIAVIVVLAGLGIIGLFGQ